MDAYLEFFFFLYTSAPTSLKSWVRPSEKEPKSLQPHPKLATTQTQT